MFEVFSLAMISLVLICSNEGAVVDKFVTGKVTHNGAKDIAKNSRVQIELRDTSLADAPSKLISSTTITDAKSFPITYKLKYNPSVVVPGHTYSVSAQITGPDGKLQYLNDVNTRAVLTGLSGPVVDIAVIRTGGGSPVITNPTQPDKKKHCPQVECSGKSKNCAYGYQKKNGCDTCKCDDPCNPVGKAKLCGPNQRCHVEKKADGTFGPRCDAAPTKKGKDGKDGTGGKTEAKATKADCSLPKVIGVCRAAVPRFYYNPTTRVCESFNYGGCGGNANNFKAKIECERLCKA